MPNLEKIIKLTQDQYNRLRDGQAVGDYSDLDPDYIYIIQEPGTPLYTNDINYVDGILIISPKEYN